MQEEEDNVLNVVRFDAGGFRFAVEASQVRGMRANVGDDRLAQNAETLIGLEKDTAQARKWLSIGRNGIFVEVAEPVGLDAIPTGRIYPLPRLVSARLALRGIRALALDSTGATLLVDLAALLPV